MDGAPLLGGQAATWTQVEPTRSKAEKDRGPRWLGNYSYFKTNVKTLPLACLYSIQYGRALDCLLCELVFADPALGPVYMLKTEVLDGFYRIGIRSEHAPKLGLIFPSGADEEPMAATPLMLPMDWNPPSPLILYGHVNGSGSCK